MMTVFEIALNVATLILLLPVCVLFAQVLLAVTRRGTEATEQGNRPRLTIVMPAHDEAALISITVLSIMPQLLKSDRLLVVADNCTDQTAALAAAAGAEVIIRTDSVHRGKGYALDYAIRHLESDPPGVVIVIDADCQVATGALDQLARCCARTERPVQSLNLMHAGPDAALKMRIAEFAWLVKNFVRPIGMHRLGLPCQLMGTGMAFPWPCIRSAKLATGHIVEDLKLGITLARAGKPPLFCPQALVTSEFPTSHEGIREQRTRWEHGHLSVILSDAPRLFAESVASLNVNMMTLALDLSVPPLALLTLGVMSVWLTSAIFFLLTKTLLALELTTATATLLGLAVLLSWARYGRQLLSLGTLAFALVYPVLKIPLYLKFLVARQRHWIRSKRDSKPP